MVFPGLSNPERGGTTELFVPLGLLIIHKRLAPVDKLGITKMLGKQLVLEIM
jgi:hypothetical protein